MTAPGEIPDRHVPVDLSDYITEDESSILANGPTDQFGVLLLRCIQKKLAIEQENMDNSPRINDDDLLDDFRGKAGIIHMLLWVLSLQPSAKKYTKEQ